MSDKKPANIRELVKRANELKPIIQIGKQGLTKSSIEEIKKHLKKRKLIKIKCLKYFVDSLDLDGRNSVKMKEISKLILEQINCRVIEIRGFTIVLYDGNSN